MDFTELRHLGTKAQPPPHRRDVQEGHRRCICEEQLGFMTYAMPLRHDLAAVMFGGGLGLRNVVFIFDTFCFEGGKITYVLVWMGK